MKTKNEKINIDVLVRRIAANQDFVDAVIDALDSRNAKFKPTDILPEAICSRQARLLLGGISDRTLCRLRKKYPEIVYGSPNARAYRKSVILQLAKNRHISPIPLI